VILPDVDANDAKAADDLANSIVSWVVAQRDRALQEIEAANAASDSKTVRESASSIPAAPRPMAAKGR
jgi:hypothetical protein